MPPEVAVHLPTWVAVLAGAILLASSVLGGLVKIGDYGSALVARVGNARLALWQRWTPQGRLWVAELAASKAREEALESRLSAVEEALRRLSEEPGAHGEGVEDAPLETLIAKLSQLIREHGGTQGDG